MMTNRTKRNLCAGLLAGLLLLGLPVEQAAAHAGKVLFASGKVTVKSRRHKGTTLKRGDEVWPHDIVMTGKGASVQIRTADGGFISIKENSKFVIAAYKHTGSIERQHSTLELVKGGMRAVTGLIGKNKPDNFHIKARGSTIGVRGTEFVVQICDNNECNQADPGKAKKPADNGVYVGVVSGAIVVENDKKAVELDSSLNVVLGVSMGVKKDKYQFVYIGDDKKEPPKVLKKPPKILVKAMAPPPPTPEAEAEADKTGAPPKPKNNLAPFEGLNAHHLQLHIAATMPIDKPRSALEEFDKLDYPNKPDVFSPHRAFRRGYYGTDTSDGQRYNLTEGWPYIDYGP